jgi:hypothetical protein
MPLVSQQYPFVSDYLAALNGVIDKALEQYSRVYLGVLTLRLILSRMK